MQFHPRGDRAGNRHDVREARWDCSLVQGQQVAQEHAEVEAQSAPPQVDAALREGRNQLIRRLIASDIWIKTE